MSGAGTKEKVGQDLYVSRYRHWCQGRSNLHHVHDLGDKGQCWEVHEVQDLLLEASHCHGEVGRSQGVPGGLDVQGGDQEEDHRSDHVEEGGELQEAGAGSLVEGSCLDIRASESRSFFSHYFTLSSGSGEGENIITGDETQILSRLSVDQLASQM